MSPVFGHGRLRLYLLKLLEESPKHGYEVIRLLQDRFLGVYSPSPGTIYPRLARLEEEGLVTHEVVAGKKVFTLTDKGRDELNARLDELADLEQEISDSVRDIAREVKEDVRETVKSLREELTQMARDVRRHGGPDTDARGRAEEGRVREEWTRARGEHATHWQRLAEEQAAEWQRRAERLRDDGERWAGEWRGIWKDTWAAFGGPHGHDAPGDAGRVRLDVELGEALADFVATVRREVSQGALTPEKVERCREILTETARRIRDSLDDPRKDQCGDR